ncbi:hypothetical protein ACFXHA_25045 [Nocardia sp. NPDC059240]|uniref:hypothetical protein n=1 Tax=Nocardia sp. NPDC059240 TaxID=3346786 RepID=UPI0036C33B35
MGETRGGWEPIALPQDQVGFDAGPGYWTGSGKAVWAAILGSLLGAGTLWMLVHGIAWEKLAQVPVWKYPILAIPFLVLGAFPVGGLLLLCRLRLGKIMLLTVTTTVTVLFLEEAIRKGELSQEPRAIIEMTLLLVLIAGLTASKSTKRWLAGSTTVVPVSGCGRES